MKKTLRLRLAIFIAIVGLLTLPAFGQKVKTIDVGKSGNFHIGSALKLGDKTLEDGMYRIKHIFAGNEHFIVIREIKMIRFGKTMGSLEWGDEIARSKAMVQRVGEPNKDSKILVHSNAANQRIAIEVWFRGENVKYILSGR